MTPDAFYARYPSMRPFVGARYSERLAADTNPRLLLVGESHYLPDGATLHLDPDRWYAADESALIDEQSEYTRRNLDHQYDWLAWINTRSTVHNACATNFRKPGHRIWKHAFEVINDAGPRHPEARGVADDIASFNFFPRPAPANGSLRGKLTSYDVRLANDLFIHRLHELRPTAIAFLSKLAWAKLADATTITVASTVTPHPASHWWHRPSKPYGNLPGREILRRFVAKIWPPPTPGT